MRHVIYVICISILYWYSWSGAILDMVFAGVAPLVWTGASRGEFGLGVEAGGKIGCQQHQVLVLSCGLIITCSNMQYPSQRLKLLYS